MSVHDELRRRMVAAMKAGEKAKVSAIRQVESEVGVAKSAPGFDGEVDDALYLDTIAAVVRRDEKSRREYEALGDAGLAQVANLTFEIDYLSEWLPDTMSEDDTRTLVREAIAETGADDPKMAGRVIGHIMKSAGRADADGPEIDGALVNSLVREELGN